MGTGEIAVTAIAVVFLVWYFAGNLVNRRRASQLLGAVRASIGAAGRAPTVQWHGRSAFAVTVGEPAAPLAGLYLLCLLEPRDFPLALAWNRLRGRRDQVLIHADFVRPPRAGEQLNPASFGIRGLTGVALNATQPHLRLTLQVGSGDEAAIAAALDLVCELAGVTRRPTSRPADGSRR
ncbi:MAG: hypothetical protein AB2385_15755 [Symbiobacterium sp.]|uniref:hypothetical protein n=1 Tax=Symbiobacterium sp. TaxID=1971213 RepID=UPI00346480AE